MNWSDERYVRLFTRDSVTWLSWRWETRCTLALLLRKVDRSGVLDTGRTDKSKALALTLMMPLEVVSVALEELVASGTAELADGSIVLPNFLAAQEAVISDRQRQKDLRERRLAETRANERNNDGARHAVSRGVTDGHAVSRGVTPAVPSRAEPAEPSRKQRREQVAPTLGLVLEGDGGQTKPATRDSDLLVYDFKVVTGGDYLWQGAKDGTALAALLKAASLDEVRIRWRRGLAASAAAWASCRTVAQLRQKWNDLGADVVKDLKKPVPPAVFTESRIVEEF